MMGTCLVQETERHRAAKYTRERERERKKEREREKEREKGSDTGVRTVARRERQQRRQGERYSKDTYIFWRIGVSPEMRDERGERQRQGC